MPRPRVWRPSLEPLEDRVTPATFLVTNSSDTMLPGSLRYALSQANLDPGSTVQITSQVTSPIVLTGGGTGHPGQRGHSEQRRRVRDNSAAQPQCSRLPRHRFERPRRHHHGWERRGPTHPHRRLGQGGQRRRHPRGYRK